MAACGGKQSSDGSGGGSSGSAGSGGNSGTGGSSGTGNAAGAGGTDGCVQDGACTKAGESCTPAGECCPCSYRCEGGKWKISACPGCLAPSCPQVAPKDGDPCDKCTHPVGEVCSYCPNEAARATCDGTKWSVKVDQCSPIQTCGAGAPPCVGGSLCVFPGGLGDPPHCAPNPCPPNQPVTCACAGALCTYGMCVGADSTRVDCICPNC